MKLEISEKIRELSRRAMVDITPKLAEIDEIAQYNSEKMLHAFRENRVSDSLFAGTTGYGYDDRGREVLERIYAGVFGTEAALVRFDMANGTHAITCALYGCLKAGDRLVYCTGAPYDTLHGVIGISGDHHGSLKDYGVSYGQVELKADGSPDLEAISEAAKTATVIAIQRSRGYSDRDAIPLSDIAAICRAAHEANPQVIVFVDNCYGEFTCTREPTELGADIMAGSLIKNPGGGLAPRGGYIVGKEKLVEGAAFRLTCPGLGGEVGATLGNLRLLYQGFFTAPHVTAQAMKTAVFCARLMELMGYESHPAWNADRSDIIQSVALKNEDGMRRFCRGIQSGAPVDSYVTPEPWDMPGYDCPVIMAAGAFIQGSSIELSADGPIRPPYLVYLQGGITFESGRLGIMLAADELLKAEEE